MDQANAKTFISIALPLIRDRLGQALRTADRAEAILRRGRTDSAVRAVLDVEVFTYEANTLLNAASLVNRLAEQAVASTNGEEAATEQPSSLGKGDDSLAKSYNRRSD